MMKREVSQIFWIMLGVPVALALALIVFLGTEAGTNRLVRHMSGYFSENVSVGRVQGTLLTTLHLYDVRWHLDKHQAQLGQVRLSWRPFGLLRGIVQFPSLNIQGIDYRMPEEAETSLSLTDLVQQFQVSFPLAIAVERARLERVQISSGNNHYALDSINMAAKVDHSGLQLNKFEAEKDGVHVNLVGRAGLHSPFPFQATLKWNATLPNRVQARGKCDVGGSLDAVEITHWLMEPLFIETKSVFELAPKGPASTGDAYLLTLRADVAGQSIPSTHIQLRGQGSLTNFQIEHLEAHTLGGKIDVVGSILFRPNASWNLVVDASDINPDILMPGWPGKLAFSAELQGSVVAGAAKVELQNLKVAGRLLEQPFQAIGGLAFNGKEIVCKDLRMHSGQNEVRLDGVAGSNLDMTFDVDAPHPDALWPGPQGHFRANGTVKGPFSSPVGTAAVKGTHINYGKCSLENLDAQLTLDLKESQNSEAAVTLENFRVGADVFPRVALVWNGDFRNHRVRASIQSEFTQGNIEFEGSSERDLWEVRVKSASFDLKQDGNWDLVKPVKFSVSHRDIKPFDVCLVQGKSNCCVRASWDDASGWRTEGDLNSRAFEQVIDLAKKVMAVHAAVRPEM